MPGFRTLYRRGGGHITATTSVCVTENENEITAFARCAVWPDQQTACEGGHAQETIALGARWQGGGKIYPGTGLKPSTGSRSVGSNVAGRIEGI